MKRIFLAAVMTAAALALQNSYARAQEAPWCAVTSMGTNFLYWDCHYASVEECVPHVIAGNRGFCNPNPAWRAPEYGPKRRDRHRR